MTKFWLVLRVVGGQLELVERPSIPSREEALAVAGRLAAQDIGARFVVLEAVASTTTPVVQVETEDM